MINIKNMNKIARLCLLVSVFVIADRSCIAAQAAAEAFDDRRPAEHICPITLQVMRDPVVAADGCSYERSAILQHLANHSTSPATGLALKNKELFNNQALKTMIEEWKPGRQSEPSALEAREANSIAQQVKEEFRKNAALLNSAQGQDIVAFLGNTGSGKSTLVNFLAGKAIVVGTDGEDYVLADPNDQSAMVIGTGGNSETLYPKFIDVDGLRFFDLPGFNDTDGSERNLVNAAFIRQILLDAASVRLVFVVGQDQFTADRSASVRQMFHCLKHLFVIDQGVNLVDEGVFIATKITYDKDDLVSFLVKRTDSKDKAELTAQLMSWSTGGKISRMFHPIRVENNKGMMDQILGLIKGTRPAKVLGINVSALYPPDTKGPLERMFISVLEEALARQFNGPLTTLSDYDRAISYCESRDFWQEFNTSVCREDEAIGLVKELCINPYNQALRKVETANEEKRLSHIRSLINKRQERVEDIERRTDARTKEVIFSLVPRQKKDNFVFFDFAYHRDFYEQVCGAGYINELTTDILEQEVVRRHYADLISHHSHEQVMRWHQKFSGINETRQDVQEARLEIQGLKAQLAEAKQREDALNQKLAQDAQKQAQDAESTAKQLTKLEGQEIQGLKTQLVEAKQREDALNQKLVQDAQKQAQDAESVIKRLTKLEGDLELEKQRNK
jgi:energy-coupling factor transporter ATP-binding protein EcfA2